jgi:hypothetical protein
MNPIVIHEPSLSSRAMLCSLSISMWSARKHDREACEEIAQRHGAHPDAGRFRKVLLPKAALAKIQKVVSEARQEHYFMTLPWALYPRSRPFAPVALCGRERMRQNNLWLA